MPDKTNDPVPACRLYLITPPKLEPASFAETLAIALDAGDVASVQLRLKDIDDDTVKRAVDALCPVAQSRDVSGLEKTVLIGSDGIFSGDFVKAAGPNVKGMYLSSPNFSALTSSPSRFTTVA